MSRRGLLSPISLSWATTGSAVVDGTVKVDESLTKIFLAQELAQVQLPIDSRLKQSSNVQINLDPFTTRAVSLEDLFTPRLRKYRPETLPGQPELTTDNQGHAHLKFKLSDTITTWKMSVIGSNENGEVRTAETEIRAFQPFFAELDPPRVLTEGDCLSLPVVLRTYLDQKQVVDPQPKPQAWFVLLNSVLAQLKVFRKVELCLSTSHI